MERFVKYQLFGLLFYDENFIIQTKMTFFEVKKCDKLMEFM